MVMGNDMGEVMNFPRYFVQSENRYPGRGTLLGRCRKITFLTAIFLFKKRDILFDRHRGYFLSERSFDKGTKLVCVETNRLGDGKMKIVSQLG